MDDLEQRAEQAARAAGSPDPVARHAQMSRFMDAIEDMAKRIAAGDGSWEALRPFAERVAPLIAAASEELGRWNATIWNGAYSGGEADAELALRRRSQEEFARALFRGTVAESLLAEQGDAETDDQLRERAELHAMDPPPFVPRSHRWWRWSDAEPEHPEPAPRPGAPAVHKSPSSSGDIAWVRIPAGRVQLGLTPAQAHALAVACAEATLRWANDDPDASMRDVADAEQYGSNATYLEPLLRAAFPARELELPAFEIRATPVTHAEYAAFAAATGARPATARAAGEHPVIGVSWEEASAFARHVGAALPDEWEWERAVRGPNGQLFPWGNELGGKRTWFLAQDFYAGWPVGSHPELATPDGIHDLITERWEWTASAFEATAAELAALMELYPGLDPAGRVRRGGRGQHLAPCPVARTGADPMWQADGTGFRLVRRT